MLLIALSGWLAKLIKQHTYKQRWGLDVIGIVPSASIFSHVIYQFDPNKLLVVILLFCVFIVGGAPSSIAAARALRKKRSEGDSQNS